MAIFRHIAICIAAAYALAQPTFAQEALVSIQTPLFATTKSSSLQKSPSVSFAPALDTLDLPFFDDFSAQTAGIPDQRRWINRYVFVNNSYPINPPTMGAATFDILDETGRVYSHAGPSTFAADTLTSKPIKLQTIDSGVYISFTYQPKGNGDMPDSRDSLTLQFFSEAAWVHVWGVVVDADTLREITHASPSRTVKNVYSDSISRRFFKVMLPVNEKRFLHAGFQFRFINYATRTADKVQGKESNCDMWNVDLVYLNKNRSASDTMMIDVAIQAPITRMLREYTYMPWRHLRSSATAQREQLVNAQGTGVTISPRIANLYRYENAFNASFTLSCVTGAVNPSAFTRSFTSNIERSSTRTFDFTLPSSSILSTPQVDADSVVFDVQLLLSNYIVNPQLSREYASNDTCVFRQYFYPYYAYDDGTAENGYGVFGDQADRAKVAVKFKAYQRDTLSGVYIYFNSTVDSGNVQPFRLTVWSDKNGMPGDTLYSESNCYPRFDSLNSYVHYKLTRPIVVGEGAIFYVGWVQQSTAFLNVGFDVNNRTVGKNYVSLNGFTWTPSDMDGQGAIMIRPSFAKQQFDLSKQSPDLPTSAVAREVNVHSVAVYPNPVRDELHFDLPDALREKTLRMEIFDLSGKRAMLREAAAGSSVNVAQLAMGSYVVRFSHSGRVVGYAKFVKM